MRWLAEQSSFAGPDSQGAGTPFTPVALSGPGSVQLGRAGDMEDSLQYTWYVPRRRRGHIDRVGRRAVRNSASTRVFVTRNCPDDIPGAHDIGAYRAYWVRPSPACHRLSVQLPRAAVEMPAVVRRISVAFYGSNEPGLLRRQRRLRLMSAVIVQYDGLLPDWRRRAIGFNIGSRRRSKASNRLSNSKSIRVTPRISPENVSTDRRASMAACRISRHHVIRRHP